MPPLDVPADPLVGTDEPMVIVEPIEGDPVPEPQPDREEVEHG